MNVRSDGGRGRSRSGRTRIADGEEERELQDPSVPIQNPRKKPCEGLRPSAEDIISVLPADLFAIPAMARDDKSQYRIEDTQQIAELVSPVRMELLDAMASIGPCSIAELADELGRPADSLYYHVRKLVKCGLYVEVETRDRGGRTEAVFDVPSRRMFVEHDMGDKERMRLIADASSAMLRLTDRNLRNALLAGEGNGDDSSRVAWAGRNRAWLTDKEIEEVNRLVDKIADIYFGAERRKGTQLHSFAFAMSPIPVGRRRRSGEEEEEDEGAASEEVEHAHGTGAGEARHAASKQG